MAGNSVVLDFETCGIEPRGSNGAGAYPPAPVSYAARTATRKMVWQAWGHPGGNNTTYDKARKTLGEILAPADTLIAHNAPFEVAVMLERMGLDVGRMQIIDTQLLAYLYDPYSPSLGLKQLAERYLGDPPVERDAVREWLIEHKIVRRSLKTKWAAHIADAPGDVVKAYCIGDVERCWNLYRHFRHLIPSEAYDREIRLQPVLARMESRGVPVNGRALRRDLDVYETALLDNERTMRKLLRDSDVDFQKGEQVANAIMGRYPDLTMTKTATGRVSTARDALDAALPDGALKARMMYDSSLRQSLKMFLRPWVEQIRRTPGRLHPYWNGTRNDRGGARTGRLSSTPNLQNLNDHEKEVLLMARIRSMLSKQIGRGMQLPALRNYVEADVNMQLVGRDYSQVELRCAAHYEAGPMRDGYIADPNWDLHAWVVERIKTLYKLTITRRVAKNIGFGILYGAGGNAISAQSGMSYEDSIKMKNLYLDALPSLRKLMREVQDIGKAGDYIETLGGRVYYAQPANVVMDDIGNVESKRSYEYKLLNYLIQGGCADLMKESMIEIDAAGVPLIMSVHDEPVAHVAKKQAKDALAVMGECMIHNRVADRFTVPLLTQGYASKRWLVDK